MKNKAIVTLLVAISCAWLISCGSPGKNKATKNQTIKVLIVDGFSNHDWRHTTDCIRAILGKTEGMDISVSTCPADGSPEDMAAWDPHFDAFDVVIQTCNDISGGPQWPRAIEKELEVYVENGGGLYVYHSGNNAFPHWPAYNKMIGLGWRNKDFGWAISIAENGSTKRIPAGTGDKTSHGPRYDALLTRIGNHPIHAGLPHQWVAADIEVYRYARGPAENLTVISYGKDSKTNLYFPVEWTVDYEKGLVYNSTLGHVWKDQVEPVGIRCAGFQTLLPRIIQWLAGREVNASVPDDFPDASSASLRSYEVTMGKKP